MVFELDALHHALAAACRVSVRAGRKIIPGKPGGCDRIISSSLPLGLQLDARFKSAPITMRHGDMLFLWTDGLSDARNAAGEGYGEQRLKQLVSGLSTENARDCVLAAVGAVTAFAADTSQFDDLTALAFIYHPSAVGI
jgi:serine phosphatase RsbU (regulator of sigma subunit)